MSEVNGKVCCNCRHCIRTEKDTGTDCHCEISGEWQSYITVMTYWCRHWAKDHKFDK